MGRRKTTFQRGHYYHVYNRSVNREDIFRSRENYVFLLRRLKGYGKKFVMTMIAYCLMPNHYHFLVRQDGELSISDFVQAVFNSYTKAFNKMYKRSGTLFEGPFKSIIVETDEYLVHLCRYIHRNPIDTNVPRTSQVRGTLSLAEWEFSNYLEWIGERQGTLVDHDFIKNYFSNAKAYQEFVVDYTPSKKMMEEMEMYFLE